ncbi:lipid A biosynthesis acyltransferase [Hahella sp. CCB-MM4]|nr:lipid A biosynthesis acyltransferase [Hahella sp. CCB-MM4]
MSSSNSAGKLRYSDFTHPKYWLTWIGIACLWVAAKLPLIAQRILGKGLGLLGYYCIPRRRQVAEVNIRLCFPELSAEEQKSLVKQAFVSNAIGFFEAASAWFSSPERFRPITNVHGLEYLQAAQAKGNGVILLGGHYSTLDLGGALFSLYSSAASMQRDHDNPLFNLVMTRRRLRFCDGLLSKDDLRGLIKLLRDGRTIWYATDQDYGKRGSVFAPFFGVPAATITATARIANKTGAAVVPFSHFRNAKGGYEVYFGKALEAYPSGDDVSDATTTNKIIEEEIRRYPDQYLWMHKRFKSQPEGEDHHLYGGK